MVQALIPFTLKRQLSRITGLVFLALSVFTAVSLFSYSPTDPSFNRAADGDIVNIAGIAGAYVIDPALQFLGLGAVLLIIVPAVYGLRLLFKQKVTLWWLRLCSFLFCLIAASSVFALVEVPEDWPFISLGGFIGDFIDRILQPILPFPVLALVCFIGFVLSFFFAINLSLKQWKQVFSRIKGAVLRVFAIFYALYWWCSHITSRFRRQDAEEEWLEEGGMETLQPAHKSFRAAVPAANEALIEKAPAFLRKKPQAKKQAVAAPFASNYELPSLQFLTPADRMKKAQVSESALNQNARLLEKVLEDFGVYGKIIKIRPGPVVTLYELEPAAGTKSSRVIGLADDIARSMSAVSTRIAVVPGRNVIGIEMPNANREIVYLRELLESAEYKDENFRLPIALGKNIGGEAVITDLSRMPHLLVAGTTGSGKSVAINTMILSFIYRLTPEQCKFIMIDPKMLELSVYDGIPHLLAPVVTEPGKAVVALKWTVKEMENRYRLMSNLGVRNISGYNKRIEEALAKGEVLERTVQTGFEPSTGKPIIEKVPLDMTPLPFIVVIVDEMADLMLVAGKDIESSIQRLAQMARAAGIHIIMATQRPSVDVITGVIKANFPTRISFQVTSRIDSRTILGEQGAEQLLGMGDMLYMAGGSRITRVHGPFVDDKEVEKVVSFLKTQSSPSYIEAITAEADEDEAYVPDESGDALYDQAVAIVCRDKKASTSYVQRCLKIGYNRAALLIERMEKEGVISPANHVGKREILVGGGE